MKYVGKLYGKLNGSYFDTGLSSEDIDFVINALNEAKRVIDRNLSRRHKERNVSIELMDEALNKLGE